MRLWPAITLTIPLVLFLGCDSEIENAFGACDGALINKLLESDFSKKEILELCAPNQLEQNPPKTQASSPVRPKPTADALKNKMCQMLQVNRDAAKRSYEQCEKKNEQRMDEWINRGKRPGFNDPGANPPFQISCTGYGSRLDRLNQKILYKCD